MKEVKECTCQKNFIPRSEVEEEIKRIETELEKAKSLDQTTFYEGYLKGLKFKLTNLG